MHLVIKIVTWIIILSIFFKIAFQVSIDKSMRFPFLGLNSYKFFLFPEKENCKGVSDKVFDFTNFLLKLFYFSFITMCMLILVTELFKI